MNRSLIRYILQGHIRNMSKRSSTEATPLASKTTKKPKSTPDADSIPKKKKTVDEVPRDKNGKLVFEDWPDFKPNLSPKEVMQLGSFGGTYFRPIKSGVTNEKYGSEVWKEYPSDWFEGLNIGRQVASPNYNNTVNKYQVKCGASLEEWESSGWMKAQDPYGWFQWYCRFYLGRRTDDDARQVSRWLKCCGPKGRWKNNLIGKCVRQGKAFDNKAVSPVVRQTLQHWGYVLTEKDFDKQKKNVKT